jgi:hypothetical protein
MIRTVISVGTAFFSLSLRHILSGHIVVAQSAAPMWADQGGTALHMLIA